MQSLFQEKLSQLLLKTATQKLMSTALIYFDFYKECIDHLNNYFFDYNI